MPVKMGDMINPIKTTETKVEVALKRLEGLRGNFVVVRKQYDNLANQLDTDRKSLDRVVVDMATVNQQLAQLMDGMTDFKNQIRDAVKDTIKDEVTNVVKNELNKIRLANPDKVIVIYHSVWDLIKSLFKR